jgi:hypothetical protein
MLVEGSVRRVKRPQWLQDSGAIGAHNRDITPIEDYREYRKSHTGGKERPVRLHYGDCQFSMILRILGWETPLPARSKRTERSRELLEGDDAEPRHDGGICGSRAREDGLSGRRWAKLLVKFFKTSLFPFSPTRRLPSESAADKGVCLRH